MLSGRGLCDELITRPEESYRLWCVIVCDLENLKNEEAMTCFGLQRHIKKKVSFKSNLIYSLITIRLAACFDPVGPSSAGPSRARSKA